MIKVYMKGVAWEAIGNGMNWGVVEWMRRNTLRWYGHIERMGREEFVKKVYVSESVGPSSRGRLPGRLKESRCVR